MAGGIRTTLAALALLAALGGARGARAQGTIADPPATFTRPVSSFDAAPVASFTGVSTDPMADHVFEMGWWYRLAGGTAEKFFPTPSAQGYVNDTSTVTWNAIQSAFRAVETNVVTDGGGPSGQVTFSLTLTNLSATEPLGIDVFNMADLDLGGTTTGDVAELVVPNERMRITDGADTAEYGAEGADAFLVLPYDGNGFFDVPGRLSDAILDDFDNSGLPSGPGDLSAGFQWKTTVIPPSGSATFIAGIAVNMALTLPAAPTTTTTITTGSTTTTTLETELCDNCSDDDGDTLVDFEDADCCATPAAPLTLGKSSLRSRGQGIARLKLTAKLAASPVADGTVATQDVTIQLRHAGGAFCARVDSGSLVRRRKGVVFRGNVPSARGVERVTLIEKRRGVRLAVSGSDAQLDVPAAGTLTATLGLRDPATAEAGNRCAAGSATFRAKKRGVRYP
jgi:hypothetical protein